MNVEFWRLNFGLIGAMELRWSLDASPNGKFYPSAKADGKRWKVLSEFLNFEFWMLNAECWMLNFGLIGAMELRWSVDALPNWLFNIDLRASLNTNFLTQRHEELGETRSELCETLCSQCLRGFKYSPQRAQKDHH